MIRGSAVTTFLRNTVPRFLRNGVTTLLRNHVLMLITIVGTKGSQGKSTLSHAIAYEKGFGIITNDIDSSVDEFLPDERVIKLRNDDEFPVIPADV